MYKPNNVGNECPLALLHIPVIIWSWYWMPSDTTTESCYQLGLVLTAVWHYPKAFLSTTAPSNFVLKDMSVEMGVELVLNALGQYHTDLLSAAWYYNTFLLSAGLGIEYTANTAQS